MKGQAHRRISGQRMRHQQVRPRLYWGASAIVLLGTFVGVLGTIADIPRVAAQEEVPQDGGVITLRSDVQEANAQTGVITARGNVQIDYPARQIYATSAQAEYFSNEQRIVLSGDVVILQEGNRLVAETVTYLVEEGRFVALPDPDDQVEATYIVPASAVAPPEPDAESTSEPPPPRPPSTLDLSPVNETENETEDSRRPAPL